MESLKVRNLFLGAFILLETVSWATSPLVGFAVAQAETAPSLIWTRTFTGSVSQRTQFAGDVACPSSTGVGSLDTDWLTGDVWVAFIEGDDSETAKTRGAYHKLNPSTGSTSGQGLFQDASFDVGACAVALDQRGRVYVSLSTEQAGNGAGAGVNVIRTSDVSALSTIAWTDARLGQTGSFFGPSFIIPAWGVNRSDSAPQIILHSGVNDANSFKIFTTTGVTLVCTVNAQPSGFGTWRTDNTVAALFWQPDLTADISLRNTGTCAETAENADTGTAGVLDAFSTNIIRVRRESGATSRWEYNVFPMSDVTTPITATTTNFIQHFTGGISTNSQQQIDIDQDGDVVFCGIVTGAQPDRFVAKANATAFRWNVEFDTSSNAFAPIGCKLAADGSVYVWGNSGTGSTQRAVVRRYCCNDVGIDGAQQTYTQVAAAVTTTPSPTFSFAGIPDTIASALDLSTFGGQLFSAFALIACCAVGTASVPQFKGFRGLAAGVGAMLGFFSAWAFDWLSDGAIFSIVIVCIVLIGFAFFMRGK